MTELEERQFKIDAHRSAIQAACVCARMLKQYDIPKLLLAIEHADALGPYLDPTLWIKKAKAMLEDKEMLEAALPLWRLAEKLEKLIDENTNRTEQRDHSGEGPKG
jgi:hypothetical protein